MNHPQPAQGTDSVLFVEQRLAPLVVELALLCSGVLRYATAWARKVGVSVVAGIAEFVDAVLKFPRRHRHHFIFAVTDAPKHIRSDQISGGVAKRLRVNVWPCPVAIFQGETSAYTKLSVVGL